MPIKIPVIIIFRNLYLYKFLSLLFSLTYTYIISWVLHILVRLTFSSPCNICVIFIGDNIILCSRFKDSIKTNRLDLEPGK